MGEIRQISLLCPICPENSRDSLLIWRGDLFECAVCSGVFLPLTGQKRQPIPLNSKAGKPTFDDNLTKEATGRTCPKCNDSELLKYNWEKLGITALVCPDDGYYIGKNQIEILADIGRMWHEKNDLTFVMSPEAIFSGLSALLEISGGPEEK